MAASSGSAQQSGSALPQPGTILRVRMRNFVTFADAEVHFGPRLNVILGPNGSGKSSVVSALALVLGGDAKVTEKASHLGHMVKKGAKSATIEVEMATGTSKNLTIQRHFTDSGHSEWRMNNAKSSEADVRREVGRFHVDVFNPLQFLPQGKVDEFAALNEKELLERVIRLKTGLGQKWLDARDEYQREAGLIKRESLEMTNRIKEAEDLKSELESLERTVARQTDRSRLVEEIELLKMILPWIRVDEVFQKIQELREEITRYKAREGDTPEIERLELALDNATKEYTSAKRKSDAVKRAVDEAWATVEDERESAEIALQSLEDTKEAIENIQNQRAKLEQKIVKQQTQHAELEQVISKAKGDDFYTQKLVLIKERIRDANEYNREISLEHAHTAAELRRLRVLQTAERRQQEQSTSSSFQSPPMNQAFDSMIYQLRIPPEQKEALLDVRKSARENVFSGNVYGPLICELMGVDEQASIALQHIVANNNWKMIVVDNTKDEDTMIAKKLSCMLLCGTWSQPRRFLSPADLKTLKIRDYLDALIVGHDSVKEAARRISGLHNVLVGTIETEDLFERDTALFERVFLSTSMERITIICPKRKITFMRARYGGRSHVFRSSGHPPNTSVRLSNLADEVAKQKQLEKARSDTMAEKLKQLHAKDKANEDIIATEERVRNLEEKRKEADERCKRLRAELDEVMQAQKAEHATQRRFEAISEQLENDMQTLGESSEARKSRLLDTASKQGRDFIQKIKNITELAQQLAEAQANLLKARLVTFQLDNEKRILQKLKSDAEKRYKDNNEILVKLIARKDRQADTFLSLRAAAEKICSKDEVESPAVTEKIEALGVDFAVDSLETAIESRKITLQVLELDQNALDRYEYLRKRLSEIQKRLDENGPGLQTRKERLDALMESWVIPVRQTIELLNKYFVELFAAVSKSGYHCAGDANLVCYDDFDLSTYGLRVCVKFREDQALAKLDNLRQSGGERSLTAFLLILAIQRVASTPFVLFDEINQGLDPFKERIAFKCLANVSEAENAAQYFWATPKLLEGLRFPSGAKIHFVFNGPYGLTQREWNLDSFCRAASTNNGSSNSRTRRTTADRALTVESKLTPAKRTTAVAVRSAIGSRSIANGGRDDEEKQAASGNASSKKMRVIELDVDSD